MNAQDLELTWNIKKRVVLNNNHALSQILFLSWFLRIHSPTDKFAEPVYRKVSPAG